MGIWSPKGEVQAFEVPGHKPHEPYPILIVAARMVHNFILKNPAEYDDDERERRLVEGRGNPEDPEQSAQDKRDLIAARL